MPRYPDGEQSLPDELGDAELISAVRLGDVSAWAALYARHSAAVTRVARCYSPDHFSADDLASEAFQRTIAAIKSGGGPDVSFRAYVYTVVRRLGYEATEARRKTVPTDEFAHFELAGPSVDPTVTALEQSTVTQAFAGIPERWQAVLWYIEVEGMSPSDVAPILGLTANGVSALAYRAREGLREQYLQVHQTTSRFGFVRALQGQTRRLRTGRTRQA